MSGNFPHPSVCFVAPFAYPVLAGDRSIPFVGGAEVQQTFIARELVARGYSVSMICMNFGQPDEICIDGITVYRIHAPDAGLPVVRFLHPRLTSIWMALHRANADIYYQRAAGALTGFVAAFARLKKKPFIYAGACDLDFDFKLPLIRNARDRVLFRWGLARTSAVVVQSERQELACRMHFDRASTLIRSCYGYPSQPGKHHGVILWVGTVKPLKRPDLFVELAKRCPSYRFRLVGGGDQEYVRKIRAMAEGVPNIEMTGFVPFADVEQYFDAGAILVNTSECEGFPNTFLQAWSRGIPTLSFFDVGIAWQGRRVGTMVDSLESMAVALRHLMENPTAWEEISNHCRSYLLAHHSVRTTADEYEKLFLRLSTGSREVSGES